MYVYVAGPYPKVPDGSVRDALTIGDILLDRGHTPFIPHLKYFWSAFSIHTSRKWLNWRLRWLRRCDAVLCLPGDTPDAEQIVKLAQRLNKPIYHTLDEIPDPAMGEE